MITKLLFVCPVPTIVLHVYHQPYVSCMVGYFLSNAGCTACPTPCQSCLSSSFCLNCKTSNYLNLNTNLCASNCPSGYYADTSTLSCNLCSSNCLTCSSFATNCNSCSSGFYLSACTNNTGCTSCYPAPAI